jgi:hypothetical protein
VGSGCSGPVPSEFTKHRIIPICPTLPERMNSRAVVECGDVRRCVPTWMTRLFLRAARTIAWPSPIVCAMGFST